MKNKIYLLLFFIFSLCLFSCSDVTKEDSSVLTENNTRSIFFADDFGDDGLSYEDLEARDIHISENYELFEGIRVFDSFEEMFSLLYDIDTMSYTDLKCWCVNNDLYNPILESRIIYDSLFSEVLDDFGYSYDRYMYDENYTIDEETVFEVFKERMISQYSDYIDISEDYDEEYVAEYYIEPLSTDGFDELIFMNDRNIVIVGISVYKLIGNIILSTSVYNFNEYFGSPYK